MGDTLYINWSDTHRHDLFNLQFQSPLAVSVAPGTMLTHYCVSEWWIILKGSKKQKPLHNIAPVFIISFLVFWVLYTLVFNLCALVLVASGEQHIIIMLLLHYNEYHGSFAYVKVRLAFTSILVFYLFEFVIICLSHFIIYFIFNYCKPFCLPYTDAQLIYVLNDHPGWHNSNSLQLQAALEQPNPPFIFTDTHRSKLLTPELVNSQIIVVTNSSRVDILSHMSVEADKCKSVVSSYTYNTINIVELTLQYKDDDYINDMTYLHILDEPLGGLMGRTVVSKYIITSMGMKVVAGLFHASYVVSLKPEKTSKGSGVISTTPTH